MVPMTIQFFTNFSFELKIAMGGERVKSTVVHKYSVTSFLGFTDPHGKSPDRYSVQSLQFAQHTKSGLLSHSWEVHTFSQGRRNPGKNWSFTIVS